MLRTNNKPFLYKECPRENKNWAMIIALMWWVGYASYQGKETVTLIGGQCSVRVLDGTQEMASDTESLEAVMWVRRHMFNSIFYTPRGRTEAAATGRFDTLPFVIFKANLPSPSPFLSATMLVVSKGNTISTQATGV